MKKLINQSGAIQFNFLFFSSFFCSATLSQTELKKELGVDC